MPQCNIESISEMPPLTLLALDSPIRLYYFVSKGTETEAASLRRAADHQRVGAAAYVKGAANDHGYYWKEYKEKM